MLIAGWGFAFGKLKLTVGKFAHKQIQNFDLICLKILKYNFMKKIFKTLMTLALFFQANANQDPNALLNNADRKFFIENRAMAQ